MSWWTIEEIERKIDALAVTQTGCSTGGTIVEDTSAGTPKVVAASSSGTANTFGSWAAMDASTAAAYYITSATIRTDDTTAKTVTFEIGTGAEASEATIVRISFDLPAAAMNVPLVLPIEPPIYVAASTRIAVRASDSEAGINAYNTSVQYFKAS